MPTSETPIFTRTFDFLTWLLPATDHFPRAHRHTVTRRLLEAAFDFSECIEEANLRRGNARLEWLLRADAALAKVRHYLRLARRWEWLSAGQYEHVSNQEQPEQRQQQHRVSARRVHALRLDQANPC